MNWRIFLLVFILMQYLGVSTGVDHNNFKTCEQSSFCRRCRKITPGNTKFSLVPGSMNTYSNAVIFDLINRDTKHLYVVKLEALVNNSFRLMVDEKNPIRSRYKVEHVLVTEPQPENISIEKEDGNEVVLSSGYNKAAIIAEPFRIDFYENNALVVSINAKGLMKFEHIRRKRVNTISRDGENERNGNVNKHNENVNENVIENVKEIVDEKVHEKVDENVHGDVHEIVRENVQQENVHENVIENVRGGSVPEVENLNVLNVENINEIEKEVIYDEDPGAWEENFKSHHDTKPYGPEAVALDFSFPEAEVLFGIPEHADNFILKSTSGTDPYRLYNLDVFEYILNSNMALYGSVPILYGHGPRRTAGVYWQNVAETWVDIYTAESNVMSSLVNFMSGSKKMDPPAAHFISESGIIDAFILLGPTPMDTFRQYTFLTGTTPLPQMFALAYHQSRWNYRDMDDVAQISASYDDYDIPLDTIWLDIEYTDNKKYFTWEPIKFSAPLDMIKNLTEIGRHLVIIIDPHIKRDTGYFLHNELTEKSYYVKTPDGKDYEGWCWPGSASYPDFFRQEVRDYYASQYLLENFKTVTADVMIWNDMNEPSVFNGPEVTAPKDLIHADNWEHRDVHNLYGHMNVMATFNGLMQRDPQQRPFILTRSHFAGTQRYAAIWTGDNLADWQHLQFSLKMCLSEAVAGHSFCGADVGGFFGNPDEELLRRWYQAGAFLPFYRAHAHIDTKRREPWYFTDTTISIIRDAIRKRYSYLPLWYTTFYELELDGSPVIRPLLAHYPQDKYAYGIEDQILLQHRLLIRPVMQSGVNSVNVYFPSLNDKGLGDIWYDVDTYEKYEKVGYVKIPVNDYKIPVYQRGGTIVPKKERIRRAATLMKNDPYTLIVTVDSNNKAEGTLYLDDEISYDYRQGKFIYVNYKFDGYKLFNEFWKKPNYTSKAWIERVIIAGFSKTPRSAFITVDGLKQELDVNLHEYNRAFVIRKPGVAVHKDFEIKLMY